MTMVRESLWKHEGRTPLSNSSDSSHQSLGTGATQNGCEVIMQKPDCLYFCHSSCPVDVIILYIFVYSYIDVHQCISASQSLWKHKSAVFSATHPTQVTSPRAPDQLVDTSDLLVLNPYGKTGYAAYRATHPQQAACPQTL